MTSDPKSLWRSLTQGLLSWLRSLPKKQKLWTNSTPPAVYLHQPSPLTTLRRLAFRMISIAHAAISWKPLLSYRRCCYVHSSSSTTTYHVSLSRLCLQHAHASTCKLTSAISKSLSYRYMRSIALRLGTTCLMMGKSPTTSYLANAV